MDVVWFCPNVWWRIPRAGSASQNCPYGQLNSFEKSLSGQIQDILYSLIVPFQFHSKHVFFSEMSILLKLNSDT